MTKRGISAGEMYSMTCVEWVVQNKIELSTKEEIEECK